MRGLEFVFNRETSLLLPSLLLSSLLLSFLLLFSVVCLVSQGGRLHRRDQKDCVEIRLPGHAQCRRQGDNFRVQSVR
jgi:hypothetical protein